jgi:hypothetical protein
VIRAGLRRLFLFLLLALGGTAAISATFGALAGKSLSHTLAVGYYVVGAGCLLMSLAFGSRGPTRAESTDDAEDYRPSPFGILGSPRGGRIGRRARRKATPEERREARLAAIGLFAFGVLLVLLGAAIDPGRRAF